MGLLQLTDFFAQPLCCDPQDLIYGILALVDWKVFQPLQPGYTKSTLAGEIKAISYMDSSAEEEEPMMKPQLDNSTKFYEWWSKDNWPIVSATRIAMRLACIL